MANGNYEFQSDFAKKHRAAGEAGSILKVLGARKIAVSVEQQERILACTDIAVLDRWIEKAVTVTSAAELFTE